MNKKIVNVYLRGYKGTEAASGLIIWFTRGIYSHNSMVFVFDDGSEIELESLMKSGVIEHEPRTRLDAEFDEFLIPMTQQQAQYAYQMFHIFAEQGAKYDKTGAFGFLTRRKKPDYTKWFCSEVAAYVCLKAGWPLSRRPPFKETPTTTTECIGRAIPVDIHRKIIVESAA